LNPLKVWMHKHAQLFLHLYILNGHSLKLCRWVTGILLNNRLIFLFFWRNRCHFDLKYFYQKNLYKKLLHFKCEFLKTFAWLLITIYANLHIVNAVHVSSLQNVYCFRPVHQSANHKSLHTQLLYYELEYLLILGDSHIDLTIWFVFHSFQ
jgi:hypothetical protein